MPDTQYLDPLTWPIIQYDYGIHIMPVSDSAPSGWGPPFVDGGGNPINGGMGTVGATPNGIALTYTGASTYTLRRGVEPNTPDVSQAQRCSSIDGLLIYSTQYRNRYWCKPNGTALYYKNAQLTTAPSTICGASVFTEGGSKYLCVVSAVSSFDEMTVSAYVRPWLTTYANGNMYDATTNPDGWQLVGSQLFEELSDPDEPVYHGVRIWQGFYFSSDGKNAVSVAWANNNAPGYSAYYAPRGLLTVSVTAASATIGWSRVRPVGVKMQYGGGATGFRWDNPSYTAIADYNGSTLVEGVISSLWDYQQITTATASVVDGDLYYAGTSNTTLTEDKYTRLTIGATTITFRSIDSSLSWYTTQAVDSDTGLWTTVSLTHSGTALNIDESVYLGGDVQSGLHLYSRETRDETATASSSITYPSLTPSGSSTLATSRGIEVLTNSASLLSHGVSFNEAQSVQGVSLLEGDYTTPAVSITETQVDTELLFVTQGMFVEPSTDRTLGYVAVDGHMFAVAYGIFDLTPSYSNEDFYEWNSDEPVHYYSPVGTGVDAMIGIYGTNPDYLNVRYL